MVCCNEKKQRKKKHVELIENKPTPKRERMELIVPEVRIQEPRIAPPPPPPPPREIEIVVEDNKKCLKKLCKKVKNLEKELF